MKHRSTLDRVLPYILASKRDVENRLATHNRKCVLAIINVQLYIAVENLNNALTRLERKC